MIVWVQRWFPCSSCSPVVDRSCWPSESLFLCTFEFWCELVASLLPLVASWLYPYCSNSAYSTQQAEQASKVWESVISPIQTFQRHPIGHRIKYQHDIQGPTWSGPVFLSAFILHLITKLQCYGPLSCALFHLKPLLQLFMLIPSICPSRPNFHLFSPCSMPQ